MAQVLERVPVDRIAARAAAARPGQALLLAVVAALYAVGYAAAVAATAVGVVLGVLWQAGAWAGAAVRVGWTDGRARHGRGRG
jgi:hypothetical protein